MRLAILTPSDNPKKKYKVVIYFINSRKEWQKIKTLHFGASGMSDFTIHRDERRKENYIKRHNVREEFDDELTPAFWSRWILWNKPTIEQSIADIERKNNIIIV